jgi:fructose/tagatose bisphosphate aldolase
MSIVPMQEILNPAFERKYGVAAFNIVDDLSTLFDFDLID